MKLNSAIALLACAISLGLENRRPILKSLEALAHALAIVPLLLGSAGLFSYLAKIDIGMDSLLVSAQAGSEGFGAHGLMAPNTSLCFFVIGIGLLILDGKAWLNRLSQRFAIVAGSIATFAVFGSFFETSGIYKISTAVLMDSYTAVALLLVSLGVLFSRPQNGIVNLLLRKTSGGIFARRMMIAAFVFPPLLGWLGMISEEKGLLLMSTAWALASLLMIILFTSFVWQSADNLIASEVALKDSELKFRNLANSIPQLAWTTDSAGNVDWYNQRWYDYTGTSFEEMKGWGWRTTHNPLALPKTMNRWQQALASGENWEDVLQIRGKDGIWRWFLSRAMPVRDEHGVVVRWFGSNTDIDAQMKAESALRESEQRYATLTSSIPQLVWTCHADGRCNYLSHQWVEYTGKPENEQLGYGWLDVIHPEDRAKTLENWKGSVAGKHPFATEFRILRHDGEYRWFFSRGTPMLDDEGDVLFWVGTCTDIHAQRLITEELNEAKLLAEQANRAKTQFLANMSHEIRTPIGAITGFTELLKNSSSTASDKQNYMMVIERNSNHLLRLIDDILDLSKVEAGKIAFENINFSLPDFLSDFKSVMTLKAAEKGIDFRLLVDGLIPDQVCSDQLRLRQILANIVGNAIKFTESGSVEVSIQYLNNVLKISVADTGLGISPASIENLFQPFNQADASFTRKFGGVGLGLVLSKRLAHFLEGDLVLKSSELGKGSTFVITVKLIPTPSSSFVKFTNVESTETLGPSVVEKNRGTLSGLRVLLVEDSLDNRTLIATYLRKTGATVDIAEDGLDGYQKAIETSPDVVLMDIQMPKMDGHEATQKLRAEGFKKPIVALTAHAMREERDRCFASGCTDYLTKPIQFNKLIDVLTKYLPTKAIDA